MMRVISPTTVYERRETLAILGENAAFRLLGIIPEDPVFEGEDEVTQETPEKSYKRQERLEAFLKLVRNETVFNPADWNLPMTIKFCFGDLFSLFDAKLNMTGQRQNFLSYGYFVNRILELHGRLELKDKLGIKEPKTPRVRNNNARLWRMYLAHVEEIRAKCIV